MSSKPQFMTPEELASNNQYLEEGKTKVRKIKRKSKQARITHDCTAICCIWLVISGLFVFIPPLTQLAGPGVVFFFRMSHRVIGCVFVIVPLISALIAPRGVAHIFKNLFAKWTEDDKKWMILFVPYLFMAKHLHMPDQDEVKSGQRIADGVVWLFAAVMGVSGVCLLLFSTVLSVPAGVHAAFLLIHDIGFFFICIFGMAHIFLGAGIFQPYRGMAKVMWGDGYISESDALYHWGHWARKELASGENVIEK